MRHTLFLFCAACALAQSGTATKAAPEEYPVHVQAKSAAVGADYMIHSFSGEGVTYLAPGYLVVEVALFPAKGTGIDVQAAAFSLLVDEKKKLEPANIGIVRASLQHPEWNRQSPQMEAGAGMGRAGVTLGPPRAQSPIPGGPGTTRPVPGSTDDPTGSGVSRVPRMTAGELVVETALPEGNHRAPVSGYLYFPYNGKAGKLKSVELVFEDLIIPLR